MEMRQEYPVFVEGVPVQNKDGKHMVEMEFLDVEERTYRDAFGNGGEIRRVETIIDQRKRGRVRGVHSENERYDMRPPGTTKGYYTVELQRHYETGRGTGDEFNLEIHVDSEHQGFVVHAVKLLRRAFKQEQEGPYWFDEIV